MSDEIRITPEEERDILPGWNQKWIDVILSTEPINKEECAKAIRDYHKAAGYDGPEVILYAPSAMIGIVVTAISVAMYEKFGKDGRFGECPNIAPGLLEHIRDCSPDKAWKAGLEWANNFIKETFPKSGYKIDSDAEKCRQRWPDWYNGGSEWGFHCCYMSFLRDIKGVQPNEPEKYDAYERLCLNGGPRFDDTEFVIFCERATTRKIEKTPGSDNYRLHCEDGPAMAYADGHKFYSIHGVEVDEQIVMRPETQTIEQIERERDEERRRIRIERFGWERYLRESGAEVVDSRTNDRDAQEEVLYKMRNSDTRRFCCSDPSTGRRYALGVPMTINSCQAAQDWMSHGLDRFTIHRS